tara:strand:+ start:364 stop:510 length:147 start_codon:yes stop_codon:yes gene_type:complete
MKEYIYTVDVANKIGRLLTSSEYDIASECGSMGLPPERALIFIMKSHE